MKLKKYISLLGRYKDTDLPDAITELVRHDGDQKIKVYGVDHALHSDTLKNLEEELEIAPADVYFVELFPSLLPSVYECSDADTAFQTFGESGYIAWLARQKGKDVRSWDNSLTDRLEDGYNKLGDEGIEAIFGNIIATGMINIISSEGKQKSYRAKRIMDLMKQAGIEQEIKGFFESHGLTINEDVIQAVIRKYAGKDIDEMTKEEVSRFFGPYGDNPINNANRAINEPRDDHAIAEIYKAKTEGVKEITILTGRDHTRLWQRPLEAMYPQAA